MASMQKSEGAILKTDTRGRVHTPVAKRESLLDEFEKSGLSGAKFASLAGIKYQTFAAWAARRRKQGGVKSEVKAGKQLRWLEAVVEQAQGPVISQSQAVRLHLAGGTWLELAELKQVPLAVALLRALEQPC